MYLLMVALENTLLLLLFRVTNSATARTGSQLGEVCYFTAVWPCKLVSGFGSLPVWLSCEGNLLDQQLIPLGNKSLRRLVQW